MERVLFSKNLQNGGNSKIKLKSKFSKNGKTYCFLRPAMMMAELIKNLLIIFKYFRLSPVRCCLFTRILEKLHLLMLVWNVLKSLLL